MKKYKILALIVCFLLVLTVLNGCKKPTTSATPTPVPSETAKVLENFMKPGDTYRYYSWDFATTTQYLEGTGIRGDNIRTRYQEMKDQYGINIEFVVSIGTAWGWMDAPLEAAYSGTPLTEVMNAGGPFTLIPCYMYQNVPGSALAPLDQNPEAASFSDPKYWDVQSQQNACMFGGKLYYAVPSLYGSALSSSNMVTIFNKNLIEEKGFTAKQLYDWNKNGEWTWEKMEQVAVATTDEASGTIGLLTGQNFPLLWTLVAGNGGDFIAKREVDGVMKDRYVLQEEKSVKAWDFWLKLAVTDKAVLPYTGTHEQVDFAAGKVAMMLTAGGIVTSLYGAVEDQFSYGVLMPPKGPDASDYISDVNWFTPVCMMRNIANPQGTLQFIQKFFAPPYAADSTESIDLLRVEYSPYLFDEESMQTLIDVIDKSHTTSYMIYQACNNYEIRDYMWGSSMIDGMLSGEISPNTYFDSVEEAVNLLIDEAVAAKATE